MIHLLVAVIVLVHLHLEYRIWIAKEADVFRKYRSESMDPLLAAKWAYLTKALWLVSLIVLQYAGLGFSEALVYSFVGYAVLVPVLLGFNLYKSLQLILALGCLAALLWGRLGL